MPLSATRLLRLNRRAFHRAVRAKDAAVTGPWSQQPLAALALVEELAGIGRHRFLLRVSALRTGQHRVERLRHGVHLLLLEGGWETCRGSRFEQSLHVSLRVVEAHLCFAFLEAHVSLGDTVNLG